MGALRSPDRASEASEIRGWASAEISSRISLRSMRAKGINQSGNRHVSVSGRGLESSRSPWRPRSRSRRRQTRRAIRTADPHDTRCLRQAGWSTCWRAAVGEGLAKAPGQLIIVEEQAGRGGISAPTSSPRRIAGRLHAADDHDGNLKNINQNLYKTMPFDLRRRSQLISLVANMPMLAVAHPKIDGKKPEGLIPACGRRILGSSRSVRRASGITGQLGQALRRTWRRSNIMTSYRGAAPS